MSARLHLPTKGFTLLILYREPLDYDVRAIFPEFDLAIYRSNVDELTRWMGTLWTSDTSKHFISLALDALWNFYHIKLQVGVERFEVLPLSAAGIYFNRHQGLEAVMDLVNRPRNQEFLY